MDEYSILKKKHKKNGFAATSLLISIALALLVLVGAVLILGKVDSQKLNTVNDDTNETLGGNNNIACVGLTTQMVFNANVRDIKEAAISYFTNERLPQTVGEKVTITLKEMQNKKLLNNVMDATGKSCSDEKTYVEVTKEENEYIMKIFLSCTDKEDYIIVHLGCYDYCEKNICEKDVQKEYEYEYKKTTSCVMTDWSKWGNWQLTRESTSNLKKEDIKTETSTKTFVDTKDATKKITYNCDKYPDYTLVGDKCVKETTITDIKDATPSKYSYNCDKYPGYNVVGDKCVKETTTTDIKDATQDPITYSCPDGYTKNGTKCEKTVTKTDTKDGTYSCSKGYTLSGKKCSKTTTSTSKVNATAVYSTRVVTKEYACRKQQCTTKTVFSCQNGKCGNTPQTSCEWVSSTCYEDVTETYISGYTCPSGYKRSGTTCSKTTTSTDTKNATFTCPDGYKSNNGKCEKTYEDKEVIDATPSEPTYSCPDGYTKNGKKCEKEVTNTDTQNATKVEGGYVCPDGYTQNDKKCTKVTVNSDTKNASESINYTCTNGYTLKDKTCTKTVNKGEKITYYRYATRSCNGGSTDIKWSASNNDSILKSEGYKLTGNKRELIVK